MTPATFFVDLDERFRFTTDVASTPGNAKCAEFFTVEEDGLARSWVGRRVWCNPPFSAIGPWVQKASVEAARTEVIVMVTPANRTGQKWWTQLIEPRRDRGLGLRVEFLPGRVHFIRPGGDPSGRGERPTFACCLLIWGDHAG
jgi:phage N-6-adenine-methyltransferase